MNELWSCLAGFDLLRLQEVRSKSYAVFGSLANSPESLVWLCVRTVGSCDLHYLLELMFCAVESERAIYELSRVLLKLILLIYSKSELHFMIPEGSFPCSQEPATGPCLAKRIQFAQSVPLSRTFQYFLPIYARAFREVLPLEYVIHSSSVSPLFNRILILPSNHSVIHILQKWF